ncbi:hypothetical protein J2W22_001260 [Sphingomonas kyeonggiensis]|uniref:hypothetical protein n=1 Tax=Sphingomonas kyeonggiensis TaxID=1268553 RepID=UPI0027808D21|nr:hypothetical protein [Sphingomonas kyeonggiensis]MDQ0249213.1 hypothetical protein [Sphingomonas kyeonggiensis]
MPDPRTCAACAWWKRSAPKLANALRDPSASEVVGVCHLNPPVVVQGNAAFPVTLYPETHESRFCGSWRDASDGPTGGARTVVEFKPREAA